MILLLAV